MSTHGKKRAARDSADDLLGAAKPKSSKKTRFVEPEDDPTTFAEQVDDALETPARKRGVKVDGYESDSSDDDEGVVFSRRKTEGDGVMGDGDEDDMFAAAEKSTAGLKDQDGVAPKKKKEQKYMRLGDIEGQEFGASGDEEADSDDEDEDEPEDEDDEIRRQKAGMGYELSSFNMREEMEEGKFTADGTYVRTYDPHGVHDRWMEGLSEKEIKIARKRKKQQEKIQKRRIEEEERELRESGGKEAFEQKLIPFLKKGETVLEALQRLGAQAKKNQTKEKKLQPKHSSDPNAMAVDKPSNSNTESPIELITHLASTLMALGDTDIYSKTHEELVRSIRRSGIVNNDWNPPSADVKYEYKWDVSSVTNAGETGGDVFGPFSEEELQVWFKASYFGPMGEKVKVRPVGGAWGNWEDVIG